jgi:SEC-C motif
MGLFRKMFGIPEPPPDRARTLKRNQDCWCGSGEKYKRCHHDSDHAYFSRELAATCRTGS